MVSLPTANPSEDFSEDLNLSASSTNYTIGVLPNEEYAWIITSIRENDLELIFGSIWTDIFCLPDDPQIGYKLKANVTSTQNNGTHLIIDYAPEEDKPIDKLRELGYNDKKIDRITDKRKIFKENSKLLDLISKKCDKIGLITIKPNFEKLISITQHGDRKALKAFKYAKSVTKENIDSELQKITNFILSFSIDETRQEIAKYEIDCISNNDESHPEVDLSQIDETVSDKPNLDQKFIAKKKGQAKIDSFVDN